MSKMVVFTGEDPLFIKHNMLNETEPDVTKEQWIKSNESLNDFFKKSLEENKKTLNDTVDAKVGSLFSPTYPFKELDIFVDDDIVNAAKGYMTGPICFFRNKAICAEVSKAYDTLEDMKKNILQICELKDMVLYMTLKTDGKYFCRGAFTDKI